MSAPTVTQFLRELPTWPWLQPQTQDVEYLSALCREVAEAANRCHPVPCRGVRFVERVIAYDAFCDPAFWAARASAGRNAERAATTRGRAAAASLRVAASRAASHGASDRAASDTALCAIALRASILCVGVRGEQPNLGAALCALWKLGCWPVGVCGEWFVLWAGDELVGTEVVWPTDRAASAEPKKGEDEACARRNSSRRP